MAAQQVAKGLSTVAKLAAGVGGAIFFADKCLYNVDGGERAVIFDKLSGGTKDKAVGEGTHFLIPFVQEPNIFDVRSRPRIINTTTGTKDLQMVNIALRVLSRPDEEQLPKIFQTIGINYDDRVLPSIGNEVLKAIVAQYNADELLTKRDQVSLEIRKGLRARAEVFGVLLDDVAITHLTFGKEFTAAIEFKQVAQQDAERSKFVVERSKQEQRVKIIEAEGESEAAQLISAALRRADAALSDAPHRRSKDIAGCSVGVVTLPTCPRLAATVVARTCSSRSEHSKSMRVNNKGCIILYYLLVYVNEKINRIKYLLFILFFRSITHLCSAHGDVHKLALAKLQPPFVGRAIFAENFFEHAEAVSSRSCLKYERIVSLSLDDLAAAI